MAERSRRTTRKTAKLLESEGGPSQPTTSTRPKRKAKEVEPVNDGEYELEDLLQFSKSVLTTMDISDLVNATTWEMLTPEARERLAKLLPPTAFKGYQAVISDGHPAKPFLRDSDAMDVDPSSSQVPSPFSPDNLDISVFTDPHFLAAAHTFQDHIYSGWLTNVHKDKVKKFEDGVRDGSLAAPWKDEEWERSNPGPSMEDMDGTAGADNAPTNGAPTGGVAESSARAGEAAEIRLYELARNSVVRVGDVLAYRRHFSMLDLVVEKDVIVQSINKSSRSITILLESGTAQYLPAHLLLPDPPEPAALTQSVDITSPSMLEAGVLDLDGRVERSKRPNGNAWKCFTVHRWREGVEAMDIDSPRGGRDSHGTLFYLRSSFYSDR
ncbi:hypothetical protein VNI00_006936 [Paramarasmius palmivorus]|uniref:ASX DEUBAD domain-containing protein n=1 Tax=Paramarasmius palmivorus TaxID=297713 RepID=A0AAW0D6E2_9AGAR